MENGTVVLWPSNLNTIRSMIDTNCQIIFVGNWDAQVNAGWRFFRNLETNRLEKCKAIIANAQRDFGVMNVTTGHMFNEAQMKPCPDPSRIGIYIRDGEDLIAALRNELEDPNLMEKWINGV